MILLLRLNEKKKTLRDCTLYVLREPLPIDTFLNVLLAVLLKSIKSPLLQKLHQLLWLVSFREKSTSNGIATIAAVSGNF